MSTSTTNKRDELVLFLFAQTLFPSVLITDLNDRAGVFWGKFGGFETGLTTHHVTVSITLPVESSDQSMSYLRKKMFERKNQCLLFSLVCE